MITVDDMKLHSLREELAKKSFEEMSSIIKLAGFSIINHWELANGYWPLSPVYDDVREPWWLFKVGLVTKNNIDLPDGNILTIGLIKIGWRKRVINIDWSDTGINCIEASGNDQVTKENWLVHAYSVADAVKYLTVVKNKAG